MRVGATYVKDSDNPATILRNRHPVAHDVSVKLVAVEGQHAERICAAVSARAMEMVSVAHGEVARTVRIGMCARPGEGQTGRESDRDGGDDG